MTGEVLGEWTVPVDWMKVRDFARAVHDDHSVGADIVPTPTFPIVLSSDFVERLVTELLPLDRSRTVHGEQEYIYHRPLRIGEELHCRARILSDTTKAGKRGGQLRFFAIEVELSEPGGTVVALERMTPIETSGLGEGA
jgi:hypothetical protein